MNPNYITISDLNRYIKAKFDMDSHLNYVYLKGEISNFKHHTRGHFYFTLKDENSRINAVMFASSTRNVTFEPEDGMKVLVAGRVSVYEATGGYQIYVEEMQLDGIGALYIEFEKLKKKLAAEGLFDPKYKKPIPRYPKRIGIITAPTGAAIRDILSTIKRRYPICETILFPALLQGNGAKESVAHQLEVAQNYDLDVIICGRGGGSIEDLWAFNEEIVARAIFASKIPVISAVGHEIDFTIADYVADLRAPTPTGAAEMAVPNLTDLNLLLKQYQIRSTEAVQNYMHRYLLRLNAVKESFILKNPLSLYEVKEQKLDHVIDALKHFMDLKLQQSIASYTRITSSEVLRNPSKLFEKKEHAYQMLLKSIELLNPMKLLESGYSITKQDGVVISHIKDVEIGKDLEIDFVDGSVITTVKERKEKDGN